jgi:nucleotide-binding universal stress UspA family protein
MADKKILVPVDFTELSDQVIDQAAEIGKSSGKGLVFFHLSEKASHIPEDTKALTLKANEVSEKSGVVCESKVVEGSIFKDIQAEAEEGDYLFVIMGTHGVRGLKQKLLGSDILKVISRVPVPVLVVQSTSQHRKSFNKIVLPVATHISYENILRAVVLIGKLCKTEVHIYSIERPGFEWPDQLLRNLEKTKAIFEQNDIPYVRVNEKQTVLSVGFARQTLQYAEKTGADMIAVMSVPSEEYHSFAQQDKEQLLTNEAGIPVLCASSQVKY